MPFPSDAMATAQAAIDAQYAALKALVHDHIQSKNDVIGKTAVEAAAAAALAGDPTNQTLVDAEASAAADLAAALELQAVVDPLYVQGRIDLAVLVAAAVLILVQTGAWAPSTRAQKMGEIFQQLALGLCPHFYRAVA